MPVKQKLSLGTLKVQSFVTQMAEDQDKVKGGAFTAYCTYASACCTVGSGCCTKNVATCIPDPDGCNPADTYPAGGGYCP